jgi:hypothetical protein
MAIRCDYCGGSLSANPRLYWRMQFCSAVCVQAYQDRLDEDTKAKIRRLGAVAPRQTRRARRRLLMSRVKLARNGFNSLLKSA